MSVLHGISYRGALLSILLHAISYRGAILSTLLQAIAYRGALLSILLHAISYRGALLSTLLHAISYRGAILSTLLHATVYVYTQFAGCTGTDCKWNGITKKKRLSKTFFSVKKSEMLQRRILPVPRRCKHTCVLKIVPPNAKLLVHYIRIVTTAASLSSKGHVLLVETNRNWSWCCRCQFTRKGRKSTHFVLCTVLNTYLCKHTTSEIRILCSTVTLSLTGLGGL
jgi:hypothetical protein